MTELTITSLTTASLTTRSIPASTTTVRRTRTGPDASSGTDTEASVLRWLRELLRRHRRRLAGARTALPALRELPVSDRALAGLGPVGSAAHFPH